MQDLYGSHTGLCLADPLEKMRESNSGPYLCVMLSLPTQPDRDSVIHRYGPEFDSLIFSSGSARHKLVWELYRSCTDTLPLDHDRDVKEKNRKKVDGVV